LLLYPQFALILAVQCRSTVEGIALHVRVMEDFTINREV